MSTQRRTGDSASALEASRALLGVVAHSLAPALDKVTLPQFRVLVLLSSAEHGMRSGELAAALGVHPSTFSRTADRLVAGGWVRRTENPQSRRETLIELTSAGRRLVSTVTRRRIAELERVLARLDAADRARVLDGLELFARAAGEPAVADVDILGI